MVIQIRYIVVIMLMILSVKTIAQTDTVIITEHPELGQILTDADGFTAYTFELDTVDALACIDACLDAWLPITTSTPDVDQITDTGTLGTFYRDDLETYQLTWDDVPLYTFSEDNQAGDINGHEVGNVWFAVQIGSSSPQSTDQSTTDNATTSLLPAIEANGVSDTLLTVIDHPEYGNILADSEGYVVYTYANDEVGTSNCVGQCLALWPPLIVLSNDPVPSIARFDFGVLSRDEQTIDQITVNELPLYYYVEDEQPTQATGHNVGNVWFIVNVDTIQVRTSGNQSYYTTTDGMTLYQFMNDEPNWSNCIGTCAETWIPYTAGDENTQLFASDEDIQLNLSLRADNSYQITLNGQPLYTYVGDSSAGELNGLGVDDNWSVVEARGSHIQVTCVITPIHNLTNVRSEPSTSSAVYDKIEANETQIAVAQTTDISGYIWWALETGGYIREDIVTEDENCTNLPMAD